MRYLVLLVLFCGLATANSVLYMYAVDSTVPDGAVRAQALLELFSDGTLHITLKDLQANPTSAGQLVSDLIIMGLTGTPQLSSSSSTEVTPPSSTQSGPVSTGWGFGAITGGYQLCIICPDAILPPGKTAPPTLLIIGPPDGSGQYSNANASIDVHSPSLFETADFTITGVTNLPDPNGSPFGDVSISFGTEPIEILAGPPTIPGGGGVIEAAVPEPGAWVLVAAGLALVGIGRKRFRR
jgi:PEP-CTERM motif-containing protein